MKPEKHKPVGKEKVKRKGKTSTRKGLVPHGAQERKPVTSPQLREAYSTKIEWALKLIPKLRKETEALEGKAEPG